MALNSANQVHVVYFNTVTLDSTGAVLNKRDATINQMLNTSTEVRVTPNSNVANSSGSPNIENYLRAEAVAGYVLKHMDNTIIITYLQSALI